jgi:hypothetical protein
MKRFFITMVCCLSAYAYGETTLRIPLFVDGVPSTAKAKQNKKNAFRKIPVAWFNSTLKKAGIKPLPDSIEYSSGGNFDLDKINQEVEAAGKKLGKGYENLELVQDLIPGENYAGDIKTCYTGRADGVWDTAAELGDRFYSDQIGLLGWKYKDKVKYADDQDLNELKDFLKDTKVWTNWKGKDDAVLILTHVGDDGDDIQVSIIDRCDD